MIRNINEKLGDAVEFESADVEQQIITAQQQKAYDEFCEAGLNIPFWPWYRVWCYEKNLFNDE